MDQQVVLQKGLLDKSAQQVLSSLLARLDELTQILETHMAEINGKLSLALVQVKQLSHQL